MDQLKIGKFIAQRRKDQGLTQMQLAEKLNITDRAVSKWETGKAMPDSAIILKLCDVLQITVNDLLNGEKISMENYNKKMEQQLLEVIAQKEASDKQAWRVGMVMLTLSVILYCVFLALPFIAPPENKWIFPVSYTLAFLTLGIDLLFMRIDQRVGYFQCKHCNHAYTPNYFTLGFAFGGLRKKYLRCPKVQKMLLAAKSIYKNEEAKLIANYAMENGKTDLKKSLLPPHLSISM